MKERKRIDTAPCLAALDILVLAGGLGRRIQPVLGSTPKLLARIAGRPYLAHLLEWLGAHGARRVVLSLGHGAREIIAYVAEDSRSDGIILETVVEHEPLGTAGAVRLARPRLASDPVVVINGDSLVDTDLCALVERQRQGGTLGTILCTEVEDGARYGRVLLDERGRIERFAEKDAAQGGAALISAGVYALSAALLDRIAAGGGRSLEHDVFAKLPPGTLAALSGRYRFIDIGTPESLAQAAGFVLDSTK